MIPLSPTNSPQEFTSRTRAHNSNEYLFLYWENELQARMKWVGLDRNDLDEITGNVALSLAGYAENTSIQLRVFAGEFYEQPGGEETRSVTEWMDYIDDLHVAGEIEAEILRTIIWLT